MSVWPSTARRVTYLVFCVLGYIIQRGDVQLEFAGFAEFAEAGSDADEVWSGDRDS